MSTGGSESVQEVARPVVGAPAPPVTLSTLDGRRWSLAEQLGQTVVLIFHRHAH